jgi:hypothetical protein
MNVIHIAGYTYSSPKVANREEDKFAPFNNTETNLALRNTTLGYGFHFQDNNSRTFPIESLAHDSGRTLVCAEYGYPKGSPNTNS